MSIGLRRFSIFASLLALAVLAWDAEVRARLRHGLDWHDLGMAIALVVLVRPSSVAAFLSLAAFETLAIWFELPQTNTNRLLLLFVFATCLVAALHVLARSKFRELGAEEWIQALKPPLRLVLLMVYGMAAWDKLNAGFFDPNNSCAVILPQEAGLLPFSGVYLRWLLILGTIATEISLPILLTIRRTRNFAVLYGIVFHSFLAASGYYSFSVTMISLLFLSAPDGFVDTAAEFWKGHKRTIEIALASGALLLVAGSWWGGRPVLNQLLHSAGIFAVVKPVLLMPLRAGRLAVFLLGVSGAGFYAWLWWKRPYTFKPSVLYLRPIPPVFWIIPVLLLFDGVNPYLGLKTETAFAMYSNLRTEGGQTNHFIWRHPLEVASYQRDLVRILHASDPGLENLATAGLPVPFFEMRKRIAQLARNGVTGISVDYERGGQNIHLDRAEAAAELAARPSWLESKFLIFRTIQLTGCPH
jgi:hypothetical protein